MIEIRITPDSPELMAKVIALLSDLGGTLAAEAPQKSAHKNVKSTQKSAHKNAETTEVATEVTAEVEVLEPAAELPEVTLEMVRARLADLSQQGKTAEVKELLSNFGATKLTAVPADKYGELLSAAEGL